MSGVLSHIPLSSIFTAPPAGVRFLVMHRRHIEGSCIGTASPDPRPSRRNATRARAHTTAPAIALSVCCKALTIEQFDNVFEPAILGCTSSAVPDSRVGQTVARDSQLTHAPAPAPAPYKPHQRTLTRYGSTLFQQTRRPLFLPCWLLCGRSYS